jgi:polygalacturonase
MMMFRVIFLLALGAFSCAHQRELAGWEHLPSILDNIVSPSFPDRRFDVTEFGAVGDGVTDCSGAIERAILACHTAGGGRVVVPAGEYVTGPLRLRSNVNLYLAGGSVLRFLSDPLRYLPVVKTRWEGVECMNYRPLLYAYGEENIAVTGEGLLDGGGEGWWSWSGKQDYGWKKGMPDQKQGRTTLFAMAERGVPVETRILGEGYYLRPNFFQPYACRNVLVQGVTFRNSPMWFLHPVLSRNISIIGVTVEGLGPNNDGCDPESCTNVLIRDCSFNTGDDCIAIKSGRNADGRRLATPTENVIIQGCVMKEGHGGVVMGSEMTGGIRNVYAERCTMDSPRLDRALRIRTNSVRGGFVENVFMRDVEVGQVAEAAVKIDFTYEEGDAGPYPPMVRTIDVCRLQCARSQFAVWIRAYPHAPVTGVRLEDCVFENVALDNVLEHVRDVELINVSINGRRVAPGQP